MSIPEPRRLAIGPLRMVVRPRMIVVTVALLVVMTVLGAGILTSGRFEVDLVRLWRVLWHPDGSAVSSVVHTYRLPRMVTGATTGAALGVAGLLFQSVSRNALGSPEIIGVVGGAALGAATGVVLLRTHAWGTAGCAVLGCFVAAGTGILLGRGPELSINRLLLVGVGLAAFWSACVNLLLTRYDAELGVLAQMWLVGTLNARTWHHALVPAAALVTLLPVAVVSSRHLAVLELGPDLAAGLGVSLKGLSSVVGLVGVGLTAAGVAATGPISFVALAAPHLGQSLGDRQVPPVVASALCGSVLLLASDWVVLHLPFGAQAPVGLATSVLGGAYLVHVILRSAR